MFALVVTQVALRYGFNESIGGANELKKLIQSGELAPLLEGKAPAGS